MAELRWNPVTREWVMIASHRQARPQMPKNWCPFCTDSGRVPQDYDVYRYPNDFPALSKQPPLPDDVQTDELFGVSPAYGVCEVLLYTPEHNGSVAGLGDAHVHKLARMWRDVFSDFSADKRIRYVYIFENRGAPVGVTMPHPHGQAYGFPFIPKRIGQKLKAAEEHFAEKNSCLYCDLLRAEKKDGRRIIFANTHFTAYVPFYTHVVYGTYVVANRHVPDILAMNSAELDALGETVRAVSGMYDHLFGLELPYMMCMHNAPVNPSEHSDALHFHIEFIPPMRSGTLQQFFASCETGAGAWCNPSCPEEKAEELRAAYAKYMGGNTE